jgi:hypothetical protein
MRALLAQATVRALPGEELATQAFSRSWRTRGRAVCQLTGSRLSNYWLTVKDTRGLRSSPAERRPLGLGRREAGWAGRCSSAGLGPVGVKVHQQVQKVREGRYLVVGIEVLRWQPLRPNSASGMPTPTGCAAWWAGRGSWTPSTNDLVLGICSIITSNWYKEYLVWFRATGAGLASTCGRRICNVWSVTRTALESFKVDRR